MLCEHQFRMSELNECRDTVVACGLPDRKLLLAILMRKITIN